jgi:hypothetical protein
LPDGSGNLAVFREFAGTRLEHHFLAVASAGRSRRKRRFLSVPDGIIAVIGPPEARAGNEGSFDMADKNHAREASQVSGVVPVLFSASAEAHDVAVVSADESPSWRSPFGADGELRPASGE